MESINNMAAAAAKAVWGENTAKQEPLSGKTGDVSKGEPYDAGNIGEHHETVDAPSKTGGVVTESAAPSAAAPTAAAAETAAPTSTTTESSVSTSSTTEPAVPTSTAAPTSTATPSEPAATKEPETVKTELTSGPAATTGSSVTAGDSSKAQNDVRDPTDPQTKPENVAAKENVDDSNGTLDKDDNPVKVDGPGPQPVADLAKARGGDAGNVSTGSGALATDAPAAEDEEDGPNKKSTGEGTGEQYVKSSGLQADGGDFDATKPGAGREADRLLEEKGVHREAPSASKKSVDTKHSEGETKSDGKPKLTERIKEKLHIKKNHS